MHQSFKKELVLNSLNFNHLFYFWKVSKFESIAKAAGELKISSPSLSTQIKQLEQSIGGDLFVREGRSLRLSRQGKLLKTHCDKIFLQYDQLDKIIKEGKALDEIRDFKCGVSVNISKHLEYLFLSEIFNNEVKFKITSATNTQLIEDLLKFELDFLLTNTTSFFSDESLKVFKLHESPYVVAHTSKGKCETNNYMIQNTDSLKLNLIKNSISEIHPNGKIQSIIDDTSLARLFAKKSCSNVIMPKIGLFDEILNGEIKIMRELEVTESYFLITTPQVSKILNLEYHLTEFRRKYTEM